MISKIFIIIYTFFLLFALGVMLILFYHFKKFKLPFDQKGKKVLFFYIVGNVIIIAFGFFLLTLII